MKTGWAVCIHIVSSQIVCGHVSHRRTELLLLSIACPSRVYCMLNKVPKDFMFFVKAHRDLIHVRKNAEAEARRGPLPVSGELECDGREEDYLALVHRVLGNTHTVIEFRHARWLTDRIMDLPHNSAVQLSSPRACGETHRMTVKKCSHTFIIFRPDVHAACVRLL